MNIQNTTLIIGGAGFVGNRLVSLFDKLNKKYAVGDINDSNENTLKIDIESLTSLDQIAGYDCIINLAAVHRDDIRPLVVTTMSMSKALKMFVMLHVNMVLRRLYTSSVTIWLCKIPMNLERRIILMIMAELNFMLSKYIKSGKKRTRKIDP